MMLCVAIRGKNRIPSPSQVAVAQTCFLLLKMELKTVPVWWTGGEDTEGLVLGRSSDYVGFMLFEI